MAVMHFSINGEFVTRHARDRIFERGWEDALRFLNENVMELGLDRSVAILRGAYRLDGVNDLTLEKETPDVRAKLVERMNYTFAGTVFDGTHYWRPYATVDNWGPKDLREAFVNLNPHVGILHMSKIGGRANGMPRNVHYMDDQKQDKPLWMKVKPDGIDSEACVLWKQVKSVPIWYHAFNNMQWQVALDEYLTIGGKYLESRGHQQWHPFEKEEVENASDEKARDAISQAIAEIKEKRNAYPPMPEPDTSLMGDAGWITPDGKFYTCSYGGHINLSDTLMYRLREVESPNPERDAELSGWIKVAHTQRDGKPERYLLMYEGKNKLTYQQVKTLEQWCQNHNEDLPYWFDEKRQQ